MNVCTSLLALQIIFVEQYDIYRQKSTFILLRKCHMQSFDFSNQNAQSTRNIIHNPIL